MAYLLPFVLGESRAVYVCPGSLQKDVHTNFEKYAKDWHGPTLSQYPIVSFELIAHPKSAKEVDSSGKIIRAGLLDRLAPRLLVIDESHAAKNKSSATTRRLGEYIAREKPIVCTLSGTFFGLAIAQSSHIFRWSLGENSPLPYHFAELMGWGQYLDHKPSAAVRPDVGAFIHLMNAAERTRYSAAESDEDARDVVRSAVSRRILETPGVIGTQEGPMDPPLNMQPWWGSEDAAIDAAVEELRLTKCLPDGTQLADGIQLAAKLTTIGRGYWQKYDPDPGEEWRTARNEWSKWCRKAIRYNRRGDDTEARIVAAVRKGVYNDGGLLQRWIEQRDRVRAETGLREPPTVAVWFSDTVIRDVRRWLEQEQNGLIWVDHIALGEKLSEELSIPYYGAGGGRDKAGRRIVNHRGGPAIASLDACGTGKNLQHLWSKNLWLCVPNEQALGRTHRPGQLADSVDNWYYLGVYEHFKSYLAAVAKAEYDQRLSQQAQKLLYLESSMPCLDDLPSGPRWDRTTKTDEE